MFKLNKTIKELVEILELINTMLKTSATENVKALTVKLENI